MAINRISAKGIVVKCGTTATPTTVLEGLKTIGLNQGARELLDVTCHGDTVTKKYVDGGLREPPTVEFGLIYDPADAVHEGIRAAHAAGTPFYITTVLPDAGNAQWALVGQIMDFNIPSRGVSDALEATVSYRATSAETFTQ